MVDARQSAAGAAGELTRALGVVGWTHARHAALSALARCFFRLADMWIPDSTFRTGVVITVRTGQETAAEPFHGWAGTYLQVK